MTKTSTSFTASNISLASEKALDIVKGSLKVLNRRSAGSLDHRKMGDSESDRPILDSSSSSSEDEYGWTPLLVFTGISVTMGSCIPVGYNIGVMNAPANIMQGWINTTVAARYDHRLSSGELETLWSSIVSVFLVGGVTGSLSGGWAADRLGRRGAVGASGLLATVAALLFVLCHTADSVEMLVLARLLVGLASGLTTSVVPMYLTEIAPVGVRGAMGVLCPLGITVGVLVSQIMGLRYILGTEGSWPYLLAAYAVPTLLAAASLPLLPESPKYLYSVRLCEQRAIAELARLRGLRNADPDRLRGELGTAEQEPGTEGGSWGLGRVLATPSLRLPLALVCALQAGQQFSGINAVFYYAVSIFKSAGLSQEESQLASIGAGGVNLGVAVLAMWLVNRFGRRSLVQFSCATAVACLGLLAATISYVDAVPWMPVVSITAVLAYVFFYGVGLGPIPYFIGSELFEVGPRPVAMALGSMANWGGNFVVGMAFPSLQVSIGPLSFLVFAAITALLGIFLRFYLPETKGRNPVEVWGPPAGKVADAECPHAEGQAA